MGERRMFTKKVTDSDSFICTSSSCQALYLHLMMSTDDDGFTNQVQMCMFKAHASIDDLKVLLAKRFILQFENGVIVIKHFRMANALRKDRYTPTNYQDELARLNLKDDGSYTEKTAYLEQEETPVLPNDTQWLPDGCQMVAPSKDKLSKHNISKYKGINTYVESFDSFWEQYPKKVGKAECLKVWNRLKPSEELQALIISDVIRKKKSDQWTKDNGQYIPNPLRYLKEKRWEDVVQTSQSNLERLAERFKDD